MILRRCRSSLHPCVQALCIVVCAVLLACVPEVHASSKDQTLRFLQVFMEQIPALKALWKSNSNDYCGWQYISCSSATGLLSLELSGLELTGRYPQVGALDGSQILIESINMSFNPNFSASLRKDWGTLSALRRLDLSSTRTIRELPEEWGSLSDLVIMNLSNTEIAGSIPDEWAGLRSLRALDLHNTRVRRLNVNRVGTGMLALEELLLSATRARDVLEQLESPSFFPSLRVLDVSNPRDTGTATLPSSLATWAAGLASLEYVDFDGYGFTGCVPSSYRSVRVLMQAARRTNIGLVLNERECASYVCTAPGTLNGKTRDFLNTLKASSAMLPSASRWSGENYCSWVGVTCPQSCGAGVRVDLSSLALSGSFGDVFDDFANASVLIDSFTVRATAGLTGTLAPSLIAALSLARHVEFASLELYSTLPPTLGTSLQYVESLRITNTRICGGLPDWPVHAYPPLRDVDLSNNRLSGALSPSWSLLPLETVRLGGNSFCGCVPASWGSSSLLLAALDAEARAAATAASCAFTNGCGNLNQQCDTSVAFTPVGDTRRFLLAMAMAFPSQLQSWGRSSDYCDGTWRGVLCRLAGDGVYEVLLALPDVGLTGTLPQVPTTVVGARVLVASIDLSGNAALTGSLPVSWGRLSYLRSLRLDRCTFHGDLPDAWQGMSGLVHLSIVGSQLCRGLPSWLAANMPDLRYFDVSANAMFGGLSSSFGTFGPQLTYFNVTKNKFCGCMPSNWKAYRVLEAGVDDVAATSRCSFAYNACGRYSLKCETLDDSLLNFRDVNWNFLHVVKRGLSVGLNPVASSEAQAIFATWSEQEFCKFRGVSCSFDNGANGFHLSLRGVGLRGTLPSISSDFKSAIAVRSIDLSNNPGIAGTLPPSWGELTNLLHLDLSNTSVQSAVPTAWQGMHNLVFLSLAHTRICGSLPGWSATSFTSVRTMDLSHSRLAGALSAEFSSFGLSDLSSLSLAGNTDLCPCAPSEWLGGHVLPKALVDAFGSLPLISDSCLTTCASPPSCVNPEIGAGSGDAVPPPHGVIALSVLVLLVTSVLVG